jgi:hypothetical protein
MKIKKPCQEIIKAAFCQIVDNKEFEGLKIFVFTLIFKFGYWLGSWSSFLRKALQEVLDFV